MSVTRDDVAGLHEGDVITLSGDGAELTGTLVYVNGGLYLTAYCCVRNSNGDPFPGAETLTVISRAPVPTFINTTREPAAGDVARSGDNFDDTRTWSSDGTTWIPLGTGNAPRTDTPSQYRLLVDGGSGRFAPQ